MSVTREFELKLEGTRKIGKARAKTGEEAAQRYVNENPGVRVIAWREGQESREGLHFVTRGTVIHSSFGRERIG